MSIAAQTHKADERLYLRLTAEIHAEEPGEALQSEAQSLNERLGGRTFVIASYLDSRLSPKLADLREEPKKTSEAGSEAAPQPTTAPAQ